MFFFHKLVWFVQSYHNAMCANQMKCNTEIKSSIRLLVWIVFHNNETLQLQIMSSCQTVEHKPEIAMASVPLVLALVPLQKFPMLSDSPMEAPAAK